MLVTGAGRGIGKRLAIGFATAGHKVGLLARSKGELDLAHLEIEHAGGNALRIRADVTDFEQVSAAVDRMRRDYGGVQVLICAAGVPGPIGPLADQSPKALAETIHVNLVGVMNACRAVLPHMIERRSGKIIVLSGPGAATSRPCFSAYAASKAALVRLVETVAEEVRDHNIQINCMATGGVAPEKQIQLALFLASEESNHISGKLIHITDDWKKLKNENIHPEIYTLRRVQKV